MKRLTLEQCTLTEELRSKVMAATDCSSLYAVLGRDFWCVDACTARELQALVR
jgi:hypothetical protein